MKGVTCLHDYVVKVLKSQMQYESAPVFELFIRTSIELYNFFNFFTVNSERKT